MRIALLLLLPLLGFGQGITTIRNNAGRLEYKVLGEWYGVIMPKDTARFADKGIIPKTAAQVGAYSTAQVDAKLVGFKPAYEVNTYADAVALTIGRTDRFEIRVKVDETNGYYPTYYDYAPDSPATDHLDRRITN